MISRRILFRWFKKTGAFGAWWTYRMQALASATLLRAWTKRSKDMEARWMY